MKHRNILIIIFLLTLLLFSLPTLAQENTVTMLVTRDPVSLDPHTTRDPGAPVIMAYIYDTLVYQDETGQVRPQLAESWTVDETGTTITFNLRDDVVFSDGTPVTADDVVWTFERLQEVGQRSLIYGDMASISGLNAIDNHTVEITLSEPSASLFSALSYPYAGILNPAVVQAAGENYGQNPVGSGPFMLEAWQPEESITLVPNPLYNGHRPWAENDAPPTLTIEMRFVNDQSTRANALLAGDADMAYLASGAQVQRFEGLDGYTVLDSPGRSLVYAGFNTGGGVMADPIVRQAVAQAINRNDIALVATEGLAQVVNTPLPSNLLGYNPGIDAAAPGYDPQAARQLLGDAGYSNLNITLITSTFPTFQAIATIMQAQLAQIGITVEVVVMDFAALVEAANAGDYDMLITRYDWNDPDVLTRYVGSEARGSTNRYFYSSDEMDALLAQGRATYDETERAAVYAEIQQILLRDLPIMGLYVPVTKVVVNNRVQNVGLLHTHIILDDATLR